MKVSILGHGVVGKGVFDMLASCPEHQIDQILVRQGHADTQKDYMVDSIEDVLDSDSQLVIECMGGIDPAFEYVRMCMEAGKSIITANKALVASHGIELEALARRKGLSFLFSAACGGAIPILQNLFLARQTDQILWAGGILNGTTNYILDAMDKRSLSFEQALTEAQNLGYAESDPTADITGLDTLRKVQLLDMVAFNLLPESGFDMEGIQHIKTDDFEVAKKLGYTIRLVGRTGLAQNGGVYAYVEPILCSGSSQYAGVGTNLNLAQYKGENCGVMTLCGQGAGRYPTASAVLRDVSSVSSGQKSMLEGTCTKGAVTNDAIECLKRYFIRIDNAHFELLGSVLRASNVIERKENEVYLVAGEMNVKEMHDNARNMRAQGARMFFAEYED